ncbi:hypothetical protein L6R53_29080 [Myxococcota bacterium]|nr:hypothetical protein [Myxococcota bacterium]
MSKKSAAESSRSAALVAAFRDGAPTADADALAWLQGQGDVDALSADSGLAAVEAALILGLAERIAAAGAARAKDVRKAARAAAHKLRSAGVQVPEAASATVWTLGREERAVPEPRALIGLPEEDGYVPFLLASYGEEEACLSGGAAGPVQGFRDDDHGHTSRSQARKVLDNAQGHHTMHEVGFHEAVALLERAFEAGAGARRPGGWGHLLSHVDADTLAAARQLDPFRSLATELDVDALHRPEPLLDGRFAVAYTGPSDLMAGFLEQAMKVVTEGGDPDERRARIEQVVDEAVDTSLDGPQRTSWAWGLNVLAVLAARAGDLEASRVARATALALEQGRPGRDIPWARELVNRQLSWVVEMVLRGEGAGTGQGPEE